MRNKTLFLLIACVCGTVAAIGASQYMQANNGASTVAMVDIFVTTQAVEEQEEITADKLRLEQWPADRVPAGASSDLKSFEGRFARQPLYAGEPVLDIKLMNDKQDIIVPRGYRVVSMPADRNGTVNLVRQGDRVDVRGFFEQGDTFAQDTSLVVLSGVKVFGIDGKTKFDPDEKRTGTAKNIQLLIRQSDEDAWSFAQQYGEISLSLGSPSADEADIADGEASPTAKKFLNDLREYRQERERQRQLALAEQTKEDAPAKVAAKPAKKQEYEFKITKLGPDGRMQEYGFLPGESIPVLLNDTRMTDSTEEPQTSDTTSQGATDSGQDFDLTGQDSPFFAPQSGAERTAY
ncbi:Flp pilus assembly protein CpaB [Stieleria varia]|uniref:SAF domain protein n=1 Tax=Stieleria varia TaxID=2528005 RepID=A0A5C6AUS6_9BACT|nr:Flp pilus assembly protein CpaB [Stieleria varia]TWU02772.1 SAF domain protein [Stieleria varia]